MGNSDGILFTMSDFIERSELQSIQDGFCKTTHLMGMCYEVGGQQFTQFSGERNDKEILFNNLDREEFYSKMSRIIEEVVKLGENVQEDTKYKNVKLIGIPIKANKKLLGVWGAIFVYPMNEKDSGFYMNTTNFKSVVLEEDTDTYIDLMIMLTNRYMTVVDNCLTERETLQQCRISTGNMKAKLEQNTVFTNILQKLEEDSEFDEAIGEILEMVGEYLKLTSAVLLKISDDMNGFSIIKKWISQDAKEYEKSIDDLPESIIPPIRETVICSNISSTTGKIRKMLEWFHIQSLICVPIMLNNAQVMFVSFIDNNSEREWDYHTKQFVMDVCKMIQTILFKRVSKEQLVSSYNALKEILSNIGSSVMVIDRYSKEILFCNEIARRTARRELIGNHCWDYFYNGKRTENCKLCIPHKNKDYFSDGYDEEKRIWQEVKFNNIKWVDGREVSLCVITDVTEKKKYQQRIEFQANNDFLTGLYNRMRCEEDLELCIREAEEKNMQGALMFIDLDNFKNINDGLGHQYGDVLLKMISMGFQQIQEIENKCYRVGGDEFIIIIEPEKYEFFDSILQKIKALFSKPWYLNNAEYYCTMSMGIVVFNRDGQDVNDLIKKADIAMYDAKKNGKSRCVFYNKGEDVAQIERLNIEKNIRYAVSVGCNEFEIYIQPIVDIKSDKCIGGEALVRWNSGKLGFMSPGDFIPLAENLGLITPIGEYVLRKACSVNKKWSDMGINVKVNVNLSIIQLLQPDVVETIQHIIEKTKVNANNLVLEVTESMAINDMGRIKEIIKQIKALGVGIALDDFGTGYSSLNYIKQMNLDIIKVDRTFIQDIVDDDYAQAFINLITDLSDVLGVKVCVEGVETNEQLKTLKETNVSLIQGFYYGKPMPIHKFEEIYLNI